MAIRKLNYLSATEALRCLHQHEISAEALLEDSLAQIEALDGTLKAWAHLAPALARAQARTVDEKLLQGQPVGRLAGIPVGIKDVYNTADMPTQMGSPIWKGFTPGNDARVVHYLRSADAVFPGKTVTAEFAVHAPGPTGNPHNPKYMPGTSSSGSAVAVAAYMTPVALGTQTAGSTLRPASYNGVFGFKPSFGILPRTGMLKTTDSLDTVGFFARTVDDLDLMFDLVRVHGLDYPFSHLALNDARRQNKGERPWQVALIAGPKWDQAEDYARQALTRYAGDLAHETDIQLHEIELPPAFQRAHDIHATIYDKTLAYYFKEEFKHQTLISPVMYEIVQRGNAISLDQYRQALDEQAALALEFDVLMQRYDALLTLTTGGAALEGLETVDRPDTCLIWTLVGAPAINLPVFVHTDRMPFGAQIVGRRYNDLLLLRFAHFLRERELAPDATNPMPPVAMEA